MRFRGFSRSGEPRMAYSAPSSVRLYSSSPRFSRIASVDLPPEGGPSSSRGLEVVNDTRQRLIDTKQLAPEQLARAHVLGGVGLRGAPKPAQHVPDVFMTGAGERHRMAGQDGAQKLAERTFPALRAVQLAEGAQSIDEVGGGAVGILVSSERSHRPSLPLRSSVSNPIAAMPATPAMPT